MKNVYLNFKKYIEECVRSRARRRQLYALLTALSLIAAGGVPDGLPLVKGIELEGELGEMFANIEYIGNCQKGFCQALARGIGDNQEALRAWYGYSMDLLNGKITVDEWAEQHQANQLKYAPEVMESSKISMNDLANPQNEPSGN